MKSLLKKSALCLLAGSSIPAMAAPLVSLGENLDLYFNGSVTTRYQSNVFLASSNEEGDTNFIFSPGLELTFGKSNTQWAGSLLLREDFDVYLDKTDLDNHKANVNFNGRYDTGVFKLTTYLNFAEVDQNTADIRSPGGNLVKREISSVGGYAEYEFSSLTSFGAGLNVNHIFYQTYQNFFTDQTQVVIPADIFWKYSEKLDFSAGYQFRNTNVASGVDTNDHFFNVGARGTLAPKLQGRIQVGYTIRDYDSPQSNDGTFTIISGLTYKVSPKAVLGLNLARDFGSSGQGYSMETTSASLTANYAVSPFITVNSKLGYNNANYQGYNREDDTYDFGIGLTYAPNNYISLSAGYIYQKNDSSGVGGVSYDNNTINVTASLRY